MAEFQPLVLRNGAIERLQSGDVLGPLTTSKPVYSATSSSLANGASLTVTHAADPNFYRTPKFIGDAFAGDSTVLLLNCNGTNGSTVFTDSSLYGRTVTANGNAQITTTNPKFGSGAALFDGSGDYLTFSGSISDFAFGSGAFTIEFWANFNSLSGTRCLLDLRPAGGNGAYVLIYTTNGSLRVYVNAADVITGSTLSTGSYYHIALCKSGTSLRLFVDGTQVGSTYTDNVTYLQGTNRPMIGANGSGGGNESVDGRLDGIRISRAALYTANFTPPTSELTAPAAKGVLPIVASGQTGITVRYDDGAGADSSTKTTFTNNTGSAIANAVAMVEVTQGVAA